MPTYQYRCTQCGSELDVVQRFTDAPLTECPECEGTLRKVYSAVGVVFKGSGFYATDSRSQGKANAATPAASKSAETKPAEAKPAASATNSSAASSTTSSSAA